MIQIVMMIITSLIKLTTKIIKARSMNRKAKMNHNNPLSSITLLNRNITYFQKVSQDDHTI